MAGPNCRAFNAIVQNLAIHGHLNHRLINHYQQLARCSERTNEGVSFISRIASLSNRKNDRAHYQQILQVLAEILVVERVLGLPWPENTTFFLEPAGRTGKRPELMVSTPDHQFLFEVKSPSLLDHQEKRASNGIQLPHRGLVPLEQIDKLVSDQSVTLPRDTPVKDFLVSSEKKILRFSHSSRSEYICDSLG